MEDNTFQDFAANTGGVDLSNPDIIKQMGGEIVDLSNANIPSNVFDELLHQGMGTSTAEQADEVRVINDNTDLANAAALDDIKVESVIDKNIDYPNIIVPKSELIKALKYASIMIRKVTNDPVASCLSIMYKDEGKVVYKLMDNQTFVDIEGTCEVSNGKPLLTPISFIPSYLIKLLTTAADEVMIFEVAEDEKVSYYVRLANGDYLLDYRLPQVERLTGRGSKGNLIKELNVDSVNKVCDTMIPLINDTQEISSKKAIVYDDRAIFKSSTYLLQVKGSFFNINLQKKELELLKLVSIKSKENIKVYQVEDASETRFIFEADGVTINTSTSIPNKENNAILRLSDLANNKYMKINKDELKRVLLLAGLGFGNPGTFTINYSLEEPGIETVILGSNGNSKLIVHGDNYNNLEPLNEEHKLYSVQLAKLLQSFDRINDLEVSLTNDGIALKSDTLSCEAILGYIMK